MSEKNAPSVETDAHGNTVEVVNGVTVKITTPKGKVYAPRNVSFKASAEEFKAIEDYRWANQLSVSELLQKSVQFFLASENGQG